MMKFVVSTLVGFVVYFLLGWLFYGFLFSTLMPHPQETPEMMIMVTAGCFFTGLFLAYIFVYLGGAVTKTDAMRNGGILMGMLALVMHAFTYNCMPDWTWTHRIIDLFTNVVMGVITGWAIWFAASKVGNKEN